MTAIHRDPAITAQVRHLYETTRLTYPEIGQQLGISIGSISRIVHRLVRDHGMKARGPGSNNRHPGKRVVPRVDYVGEPAAHQYVDRAPCVRCGVRKDKHGPNCGQAFHEALNALALVDTKSVDRAWQRMFDRAYELAVMERAA